MSFEYDEYIRAGTKWSMFMALDRTPDRVLDLLGALRAGRVNGFWYCVDRGSKEVWGRSV